MDGAKLHPPDGWRYAHELGSLMPITNGARFPVRGATPGFLLVGCTATGTDGNDCTITEGKGFTSIVRTGEGKYTVTLNQYGQKLIGHVCTLDTAVDAVGRDVEVKTVTLGGTGTILIETWTRATDTTAAAQGDVVTGETLRLNFFFAPDT